MNLQSVQENVLALHRGATRPRWRVLADAGASYLAQVPLQMWLAIPPHPRQRDARKQAKTISDFLSAAKGAQRERLRWVTAADLEGQVFKVDGHARSVFWELNPSHAPDQVIVTVFRCDSREDLNALYATFDAAGAAETMYDRVCGAYHEHGLTLNSKRLRYGSIVDALHIATRGTPRAADAADLDVYEAVGAFRAELLTLDALDPQPEVFVTGLVAASLIALSLSSVAAGEFFGKVSAGQGSKKEGRPDPVERVLLRGQSLQKANTTRQRIMQVELCGAALMAFDAWRAGEGNEEYWNLEFPDSEMLRRVVLENVNLMRVCKGIASERSL